MGSSVGVAWIGLWLHIHLGTESLPMVPAASQFKRVGEVSGPQRRDYFQTNLRPDSKSVEEAADEVDQLSVILVMLRRDLTCLLDVRQR
jgi:hypothetical protein